MAHSIFARLLLAALVFGAAQNRSDARPACFGGAPEVVASHQPGARIVGLTGGALYWVAGADLRRLELGQPGASPTAVDTAPVQFDRIGAIDRGQIFGVTDGERLVVYDLQKHAQRTVAAGKLSAHEAPVTIQRSLQVDARYVYYWQDGPSSAVMPVPAGSESGLFRVPRAGQGSPELLVGAAPPFWAVGEGFAFFFGRDGLMRRALRPDAAPELFAHVDPPRERWLYFPLIKVTHDRVYFARSDGIWTVPLDKSAAPVRRVEVGPYGVIDLLVAGGCMYWADERRIYRLALDGGAPATPEVIADERVFQLTASPSDPGPRHSGADVFDARLLATDGHFLYWTDMPSGRVLRVGRDGRPQAPPPPSVAKLVGGAAVVDLPPPESSTWDQGCAVHRACARPTPELPVCSSGLTAIAWAELEAQAESFAGKSVDVRGPLVLGWLRRGRGGKHVPSHNFVEHTAECAPGECCRKDPATIALSGGSDELTLDALACMGDDSRRCCNAPPLGQTVIASGVLSRTRDRRWTLTSPRLCVEPRPDGGRRSAK